MVQKLHLVGSELGTLISREHLNAILLIILSPDCSSFHDLQVELEDSFVLLFPSDDKWNGHFTLRKSFNEKDLHSP